MPLALFPSALESKGMTHAERVPIKITMQQQQHPATTIGAFNCFLLGSGLCQLVMQSDAEQASEIKLTFYNYTTWNSLFVASLLHVFVISSHLQLDVYFFPSMISLSCGVQIKFTPCPREALQRDHTLAPCPGTDNKGIRILTHIPASWKNSPSGKNNFALRNAQQNAV